MLSNVEAVTTCVLQAIENTLFCTSLETVTGLACALIYQYATQSVYTSVRGNGYNFEQLLGVLGTSQSAFGEHFELTLTQRGVVPVLGTGRSAIRGPVKLEPAKVFAQLGGYRGELTACVNKQMTPGTRKRPALTRGHLADT